MTLQYPTRYLMASKVFWLLTRSSDLMPLSWELFPEMIGLFAVGLSEVGLGLSNSQKEMVAISIMFM